MTCLRLKKLCSSTILLMTVINQILGLFSLALRCVQSKRNSRTWMHSTNSCNSSPLVKQMWTGVNTHTVLSHLFSLQGPRKWWFQLWVGMWSELRKLQKMYCKTSTQGRCGRVHTWHPHSVAEIGQNCVDHILRFYLRETNKTKAVNTSPVLIRKEMLLVSKRRKEDSKIHCILKETNLNKNPN